MDYLREIESIITDLEASNVDGAAELREIYDYSFSGTELLMKSVHFLLGIKSEVDPHIKLKIFKLEAFCKDIDLFPRKE